VHVSAGGALHQRQDVEPPLGQRRRFGVRVGRLEHQREQTVAARVEELEQTPAQGCRGVGRRHELDVAAAFGEAHRNVGAEAGDRGAGEVDHRHPERVAERGRRRAEVLHGDGDAGHGSDQRVASCSRIYGESANPLMSRMVARYTSGIAARKMQSPA
jgi:hypothetical protein